MKYSEEALSFLEGQTGFLRANIEKVARLIGVLEIIRKQIDPNQRTLALKGGTAVHLFCTHLLRLSVDVDLDYVGSIDKETTKKDREHILATFDNEMRKEGYWISDKTRESYILSSRSYAYHNAFGNKDNIKVEINFVDRIHVCPDLIRETEVFNRRVSVMTPSDEELYAMKICALVDRCKPRDLFDVITLSEVFRNSDKDKIRRLLIFYLSLDGIFDFSRIDLAKKNTISFRSIRAELLPVLARSTRFDYQEALNVASRIVSDFLTIDEKQREYLSEFSKGSFRPELLFLPSEGERAAKHPMALWRIEMIQKRKK